MNKAKLVRGLKGVVAALDAALDEQQRAANGQFGSGSGGSSKPKPGSGIAAGIAARKKAEAEGTAQKAKTGMHGGFAGAEPGKSREQNAREAVERYRKAVGEWAKQGSSSKKGAMPSAQPARTTPAGESGRLRQTLATNASRNAKK